MQRTCNFTERRKETLEYCISSRVQGRFLIPSLPGRWIVHRARAILLARFKWMVVKLRDLGAKQPQPAPSFSPFPVLKSPRNGAEHSSARAGATVAARKETQEAVILVIVSKSTCELMRLRAAIYADTSVENRKKNPRERDEMEENAMLARVRERGHKVL